MVFVRKKAAVDWALPKYDPKSKYISAVLHFGGVFHNMPNTEYLGGERLVYDMVKADEIKMSDLDDFSLKAGIKFKMRYHMLLRDGGFKLLIDDDDLCEWAAKFLDKREIHVYVEDIDIIPQETHTQAESENDSGYESYEDPDFIVGNEIEDDDDQIFEENVDVGVELEGHEVDPRNIISSSVFVDINVVEASGGQSARENEEYEAESSEEEGSDHEVDVVEMDDVFDESRLSEEELDEPNYPVFNPRTMYNPEFELAQIFSSKKEFKLAAQSHAIKHSTNIKFTKNDARRIYVKCLKSRCNWTIHVLKRVNEETWQIRSYYGKHSCVPSSKVKKMTSTWISERFLQRFQSDKGRSVTGFMQDVSSDTRITMSWQQAYRAKAKALIKIEGDPDLQYSKLWSYTEELRRTNPGSTIILGTYVDAGVVRFDRFYCCFDALKKGFVNGCRPLLGVDGCWLKTKHGGILLTAVGVDGNNNLFPVAYAVVEKKNGDIWEWFLTVLKQDLKIRGENFTFISDKQKGLISAFESVFPGVDHRFCVRHMHNNLKNHVYRGLAYKIAMWKAACSTTMGEFNLRMNELKSLNEGAWEWFLDKSPAQWSKAYFSEKSKCDMLLNNVCETFNWCILPARDKAIITILEWVREHLMKRMQKNRDRARARWRGRICPRIKKILERNEEKVGDCVPIKASDRHYQVSCSDLGQYTVDLELHICSCRGWQLTGIPCTHAMAALLNQAASQSWYQPPPTVRSQGPTMYQQLHMGQASIQPRVQIRAPPPTQWGTFSYVAPPTVQTETQRNIIVEGGQKFMNLSTEPTGKNDKGKRKANPFV